MSYNGKCLTDCGALRNDSSVCVKKCPSNKFVGVGGICVDGCSDYVLEASGERICLEICSGYYGLHKECYGECPADWVLAGRYCYKEIDEEMDIWVM